MTRMFYECIDYENDEEREWFEDQLQIVCVYGDKVYREDEIPGELKYKQPDRKVPRFLLDCENAEDYHAEDYTESPFRYSLLEDSSSGREELPFRYSLLRDPPPGRVEVHTFQFGDPYPLAWLIHKYLKRFHPDSCYGFSYSLGDTVLSPSMYGGGAFFVTADGIKWISTDDFLENCYREFEYRKMATHTRQ